MNSNDIVYMGIRKGQELIHSVFADVNKRPVVELALRVQELELFLALGSEEHLSL